VNTLGADESARAPESSGTEWATSERAALFVFLVAEAVAFVFYAVVSRPMWFYLDEWDFLADRTAWNIHDLFRAHNEHWVTLPVLVYRGLWWVFGLNSYRPYQFVIILLHLIAALLVRTIMRRVGVRPWTATVVAGVLVFFGSGYQNIVLPFQMTLVGALVFGLVDILFATHEGGFDRRDVYGLLAGLAAVMCSGVGVSMIIAVGVAVLLLRGWRLALLHTAPFAAAYLAWFVWIGHVGYDGYHASPGQVVRFVRTFVAATFGALGHYRGVGIALGVMLIAGLLVAWLPLDRAELRRQAAIPVALLVGALALLTITGYGRAGVRSFTEKSRYLHLVAALVLPAFAVAADALMRKWRALIPAVIVLLLVGIPSNVNLIRNYMHRGIVKTQAPYKQMMLSIPRISTAKEVPRDIKPDQYLAHFVTVGWLLDGVASGRIPKPGKLSTSDIAMADLRLSFRQRAAPFVLGKDGDCVTINSRMVWSLRPGERIVMHAPNNSVRVMPENIPVFSTYPFRIITVVGANLVAVRPVRFRLSNSGTRASPYAQVCAARPIVRAAQATSTSP
jgi:hypothetical protein